MPFYQKRGQIPEKRHTQFYDDSDKIYWEELISREGFNWIYSNVYHINPPTAVSKVGEFQKNIWVLSKIYFGRFFGSLKNWH